MSNLLRLLVSATDVTDRVLERVDLCVEGWFCERRLPMPQDEFIDRLCETYGYQDGWDIEQLDTAAVRKIMRRARQTRSEVC